MVTACCGDKSNKPRHQWLLASFLIAAALVAPGGSKARGQMITGDKMTGFAQAVGLEELARGFTAQQTAIRVNGEDTMANVLWPGQTASVTLHVTNQLSQPLTEDAVLRVVHYRTSVPEGQVWGPTVYRIDESGHASVALRIPADETQDVDVTVPVGSILGGYGMVLDVPGRGSAFVGSLARVLQPEGGRVQFPKYALDATWPDQMNEGVFRLFKRIGVKGMRLGAHYSPANAPEHAQLESELAQYLDLARSNDISVMLTIDNGTSLTQPLQRPRPWLDANGVMEKTQLTDYAWFQSFDNDFQQWVYEVASRYGWPNGNVNAMELWNEPWEGISISGWAADIPRYREIYTHMAQGIEHARAQDQTQVLIGGTCSSSNARDKLFSDGSDKFLKWLDFVSIHYQALGADPALVPEWIHRKGPYGPVRVWDTESWIANSEDRLAGVIASMRAQGQDRTTGIYGGNVYTSSNLNVDGHRYPIVQAWSPAAAIAASQRYLGQRDFRKLLFAHGLPWAFVFDGLHGNADDGTVVIMGDLRKIYPPNRVLYRSVSIAPGAKLILSDPQHLVRLYDFYGNPIASGSSTVTIPLNGLGYYVRAQAAPGSFQRVLHLIRHARIEGIAPVEITARDATAPVTGAAAFRLTLTNMLNRPVAGHLHAAVQGLTLSRSVLPVSLAAGESKTIPLTILAGGKANTQNLYHLHAEFIAGADGVAVHDEEMRVNRIAFRTISVDGNLSDWAGVLPQQIPDIPIMSNMTEQAWLPFKRFDDENGSTTGRVYLAYDDLFFYVAADVADTSVDPGMLRFAMRDNASYFYPQTATAADGTKYTWPAGIRRFTYRRNFDIPSGSAEHDNMQIAFNVLNRKPWLASPPGTPAHFITYWDTDYEYALNPVAPEFGGGTEVWRLLSPGMPRKHFFPREPHSPVDGGPVPGSKLVIRREKGRRIIEAAIPWAEIPAVRQRIFSGETIKFSCRVNDNDGPAHELAIGRSVSKDNPVTFHDDWQTHWANELEFGADVPARNESAASH